MRKLFGYCLLNQAEVDDLIGTIEDIGRELGEAKQDVRTLQGRTRKHLLRLLREQGIPYDPERESDAITASLRKRVCELADELEMLTGQLHAAAGRPGEERLQRMSEIAAKRQSEREDK